VITRAFLAAGLRPEQLLAVEIDPGLVRYLRDTLAGVTVLEGDARTLPDLLPRRCHGRIGTVICGIPLVLLPVVEQRQFVDAMAAVAPGRGFLHYSYCVTSPLPWRKLGLHPRRVTWTPLNLPPAGVWRYVPHG
jgi:phosphatidylethanolamine/phosphatidyl-N-methylethanolamine N-methyltransferase